MKKPKKTEKKNELLENLKRLQSSNKKGPKKHVNPFVFLLLIAIIIVITISLFSSGKKEKIDDTLSLNKVIENYNSGTYSEIIIEDTELVATKKAK